LRVGRINLGAALVVIGLLLALMKWGFLDWSLWWKLGRWWPAFLVVFGLNLVLQRTRLWFIPTVLGLLVVIFAVTIGGINPGDWQTHTLVANQSLPAGTQEARICLDMGAGRIRLVGPAKGLYEAEFRYFGDEPSRNLTPLSSQAVKVDIRQEDRRAPKWMRGLSERWDLQLSSEIPNDVEVFAAAVDLGVFFGDYPLRVLDVSAGYGRIELQLAETGFRTDIFINATVTDITLIVPPRVGVLVQMASLLTSHNMKEIGYIPAEDGYRSANYSEAESAVYIYVAATAARLKVKPQNSI
jgi:hypothetical protein